MVGQNSGEMFYAHAYRPRAAQPESNDAPLTDSQLPGLMIHPNANGGKWARCYVSLRGASAVKWGWVCIGLHRYSGSMQQAHSNFGSEDVSKAPCGYGPLIPESCFSILGHQITKGTRRCRVSCSKHSRFAPV